jgi:hypothetical protein
MSVVFQVSSKESQVVQMFVGIVTTQFEELPALRYRRSPLKEYATKGSISSARDVASRSRGRIAGIASNSQDVTLGNCIVGDNSGGSCLARRRNFAWRNMK